MSVSAFVLHRLLVYCLVGREGEMLAAGIESWS